MLTHYEKHLKSRAVASKETELDKVYVNVSTIIMKNLITVFEIFCINTILCRPVTCPGEMSHTFKSQNKSSE
jgi:hypothetical protein